MTDQAFGKFSKNRYGIIFETISENSFNYVMGLMTGDAGGAMHPPKNDWIGYTNYINGYNAAFEDKTQKGK